MRVFTGVVVVLVASGCLSTIDESKIGSTRDVTTADAGGSAGEGGAAPPAPTPDGGATSDDLLGHWTFEDEGTSSVVDASGRGNTGSVSAPAKLVKPGGGGTPAALALDGTTSFEVLALNGVRFPRAGTLSFWFRNDGGDVADTTWGLFDVSDNQRNHFLVRQDFIDPARFEVQFQPGAGSVKVDADAGKWHHLVVAWEPAAGVFRLLVDGLVNDSTLESDWSADGQRFQFGTGFVGALDEVRLYGRALSTPEMAVVP